MSTFPNFFILGAPKCGTTSMAAWLSEHPEIFISPVKEPHHFNYDHDYNNFPDRSSYLNLFDAVKERHQAVGEASVFYLFSEVAVREIESVIQEPRYIVMVRNPVEMAYSLHEQQLVAGNEHIESFEAAWEKSDFRLQGEGASVWCREPRLLAYKQVCMLGGQLCRLFKHVPRDRVHVTVMDDLKKDAGREYRRVLRFLGVGDDGRTEFSARNTAKRRRSKWLRRLVKAFIGMKQSLGIYRMGTGLLDGIDRINTDYQDRPPLPDWVREKIAAEFEEDVRLLGCLLDRDLDGWFKNNPTVA